MQSVIDEVFHDEKLKQRKRGIKLTVVVLLSFITLIMFGFINKITSPRILKPIELQINGARVFERPRELSAFNLVTHGGQKFTLQSLHGQWSLLFFGFSQCPDVCPTTLAMLNQWYQTLDRGVQISTQVAMVSVDPARDSQELLAQYVPYFNPNFMGVRGDFLDTKRFANQLNVAFNKVVQGDDYSIDHSAHIALIDPQGNYYGYFKPPFDPARLKLTYLSIRATY
jgi:protein SCO1/2|tara:strand:+ start:2354 stop:3031 length:678 start_codon:yes stop_codon:yes gene_type:complete